MKSGNKILFVLCVIAIAVGVAIYLEASSFQKTAKFTMGTVVNSSMSRYEIMFTSDDGIERTIKRTQSSKGGRFHDGEKRKVFYQVADPDKTHTSDGKIGGRKVVLWSFIMVLFNMLSVYQGRKKDKSENYFKTTGWKTEAEILKIDIDMETTIMKKNPYFIECKWVDPMTGREYRHTIKYIWKDPETLLAGRKSLDVYIDRKDPEKYFLDIAFLGDGAK